MRKVLKLNEFVEIYNELESDTVNESIDFESLTPSEIEALIYNQIIAVEEEFEITEGLKDIVAAIGNPVTFMKLKSAAGKYQKGLIAKYKTENQFQDKKDDADTKEEKDRIEVLKKQKLAALNDKITAISSRMDDYTEGKTTLQKLASLMRSKAKIAAAEAGIADADERAEIIDRLNASVAKKEQALRKAAEERQKSQGSAASSQQAAQPAASKTTSAAPKAPAAASPQKKKVANQNSEEDASKDAKSMSNDALEKKVRELKSEREADASRLAALKEKLTGRSVAGKNGVIEKIEDLKTQLTKAAESSKKKIQSQIDALQKEKESLEAQIKDQEEGKAITDKLYTKYSNELQSRK